MVDGDAGVDRAVHEAADRADLPFYVAAGAILIVVGAVVRTWLLNWISGPVFVVVCVAVLGMLAERRAGGRRRG